MALTNEAFDYFDRAAGRLAGGVRLAHGGRRTSARSSDAGRGGLASPTAPGPTAGEDLAGELAPTTETTTETTTERS